MAIGISRFALGHWAVHGLVMGLVFSLPASYGAMLAESPEISSAMMFFSTLIMGGIYGVLIELITSVLFKAKTAN